MDNGVFGVDSKFKELFKERQRKKRDIFKRMEKKKKLNKNYKDA